MNNDIESVDHSTVKLYQSNADDLTVARAAWVSQSPEADEREAEPGRVEGLIRYLMRNQHMSCFEHCHMTFVIDTPIFVARQIMRHRSNCLDGDTKVAFSNGKSKTIREHWEHWNLGVSDSLGRRRILPSVKNATVLSVNEDTGEIEHSRVLDVIKGEPKQMFKLTTERGFSITASADHKMFTANGWLTVKELVAGESLLMVRHKRITGVSKRATPGYLRTAINNWSTSQREVITERDGDLCSVCGATAGVIVDHRIPVARDLARALDLSNLQLLCEECNRAKTNGEQSLADRKFSFLLTSPDLLVDIETVGIRDSFDLVLDDPHHNFFGNGIVTHNSYNEWSARYSEMRPRFYTPYTNGRPLVQSGKIGHYTFEQGSFHQGEHVDEAIEEVSKTAWGCYEDMLSDGIAKEVARMVLPVNTMTTFWMTTNVRNLLHFLDLRNDDHAQYEVREVARQMEDLLASEMPMTYAAYKQINTKEEA